MISFIAEARAEIRELKMFLEANSQEEIKQKHYQLYMVLVLCAMNPDLDHVHDQICQGQEIHSMED